MRYATKLIFVGVLMVVAGAVCIPIQFDHHLLISAVFVLTGLALVQGAGYTQKRG